MGTSTRQNPGYRYELLTDAVAERYVFDQFEDSPDVVHTFRRIDDRILRADFLRYLLILKEGGVYTDIDTDCSRPIDTWIPSDEISSTGCVIGIEYDAQGGPLTGVFPDEISLCQWTFMAAPNHPVMQHVVARVVAALQAYSQGPRIVAQAGEDVLELTGPAVSYHNISNVVCNTNCSRSSREPC